MYITKEKEEEIARLREEHAAERGDLQTHLNRMDTLMADHVKTKAQNAELLNKSLNRVAELELNKEHLETCVKKLGAYKADSRLLVNLLKRVTINQFVQMVLFPP